MNTDIEETRTLLIKLLEATRRETRLALSGVDSERVIHNDRAAWRVRDILGHVGVWNGEAAKSLRAHSQGNEYCCITSEAKYDEYNSLAVEERRTWNIAQVWAEYESSYDQIKFLVETMTAGNLNSEMLYPWNERGAVRYLVEVMMKHESDHMEIIIKSAL